MQILSKSEDVLEGFQRAVGAENAFSTSEGRFLKEKRCKEVKRAKFSRPAVGHQSTYNNVSDYNYLDDDPDVVTSDLLKSRGQIG